MPTFTPIKHELSGDVVNLRVVVAALVVVIAGIVAILLGQSFQSPIEVTNPNPHELTVTVEGPVWWAMALGQLGSLLLGSAAIAIVYELVVRKAFLREVLAKVGVADSVRGAGIIAVTRDFDTGIEWKEYLRQATQVDLFLAYGNRWRTDHAEQLAALATNPRALVRVILPDPRNDNLVSALAKRFSMSETIAKDNIERAIRHFLSLANPSNEGAQYSGQAIDGPVQWHNSSDIVPDHGMHIYLFEEPPLFTIYRMNSRAVLASYSHRKGDNPSRIPAIVCGEGGDLYDFATEQFSFVLERCNRIELAPNAQPAQSPTAVNDIASES